MYKYMHIMHNENTEHAIFPRWYSVNFNRLTLSIRFAYRQGYLKNYDKFTLSIWLKSFANLIYVHKSTVVLLCCIVISFPSKF